MLCNHYILNQSNENRYYQFYATNYDTAGTTIFGWQRHCWYRCRRLVVPCTRPKWTRMDVGLGKFIFLWAKIAMEKGYSIISIKRCNPSIHLRERGLWTTVWCAIPHSFGYHLTFTSNPWLVAVLMLLLSTRTDVYGTGPTVGSQTEFTSARQRPVLSKSQPAGTIRSF